MISRRPIYNSGRVYVELVNKFPFLSIFSIFSAYANKILVIQFQIELNQV